MTKVYIWNANIGGATLYGQPTRVRRTSEWEGAPGQAVEHVQRTRVQMSGEIIRTNAPDFDIVIDRLRGGVHLVALWDFELRAQNGWDLELALNSSAAEFWRADGNTSIYAGEAANPPTGPWRSINATCNGGASAGAVSLPLTGLLASEVIPKGDMLRIGDFRHRALTAVTADGSGNATVTLSSPLRAAVSNGAAVRVPGDFFVGNMVSEDIGAADVDGLRTFTLEFVEVYEDEITDNSVSPPVGFEYVVD